MFRILDSPRPKLVPILYMIYAAFLVSSLSNPHHPRRGRHLWIVPLDFPTLLLICSALRFRFDKMTQQLLVIKKYAKHGPSGGGGERLSDVGGGAAAAEGSGGGPSTPKVEPNSASTADVLATVSGESKASLFEANDEFLHGF